MSNFMSNMFGKRENGPQNDRLLEMEREIQLLKLEISERDARIARLQADLDRHNYTSEDQIKDRLAAQNERLIEAAASPASQLMAQAYLLEAEGKPVQAKDILAVARRLVEALKESGMSFEGTAGEAVSYQPEKHTLLASSGSIKAGDRVRVRIPGVLLYGKILRKASVDRIGEDS